MPFTLSHAAAVLPAVRREGVARGPLLASALVAGSFAPDMTYFADSAVPGGMAFGEVTHGPVGVLTVDVLIAAALVAGWLLVREPLLALVPRAWRGRAYGLARGAAWRGRPPLRLALAFWVSAVLGAVTHVGWDAFTHPGRWGTRLLPVLGEPVAGMPLYSWVQYGSSALALVAIAAFVGSALRRLPDRPVPGAVPVLSRGGRAAVLLLLALATLGGVAHRCARLREVLGDTMVLTATDYVPTALFGAGAGLLPALALYAVAARVWHGRARRRGAGPGPGRPGGPAGGRRGEPERGPSGGPRPFDPSVRR
ncbi:DUF4184 family protein [Streptomyces sp. URMC 123]|uniref:DUF4184 family protein n=1 Tax=Streptomyces sp. URMC 123 TaxID=3423403 RepID=UPI003F1C7508